MRPICPHCQYLLSRCLCDVIESIPNKTTLIILQHSSELAHALNTVRVMSLVFSNMEVYIGEDFQKNTELINRVNSKKTALVFPGEDSLSLRQTTLSFEQLILLDGTWKKAKKIYYSNPFLATLPKLMIDAEKPGNYRIRQSSLNHSYSTLEASVLTLSQIEPLLETEVALRAFNKMIDLQIKRMGAETYEKNYLSKKKGDE